MISNAMIQKWLRMLRHDSVLHVEQAEGQYYSVSEIAGYYNNFCEMCIRDRVIVYFLARR